ncbi:hypothetical protein [Streptomyces sp. NPDC004546]|uniref:alpha/beta fold hydrolase n=1 Tax=Streptomyces sp. NPDC004546 TaxID=3154282 RepID=UPI0033BCAA53
MITVASGSAHGAVLPAGVPARLQSRRTDRAGGSRYGTRTGSGGWSSPPRRTGRTACTPRSRPAPSASRTCSPSARPPRAPLPWSAEDLRALRAPTLLVVGGRDFVRIGHAAGMRALIRDARPAVLPGTTRMALLRHTADLPLPPLHEFPG